jgi:AcrR family transcriptional regulator
MAKRASRLRHDAERRESTRARLAEAALRLMSERGINATSVSEIAAAAELANGTFYLYFKDKAAIVAAVCQAVTLAMHNEMNDIRILLNDSATRVAFGTYQFIEIAAAEPVWGGLLVSAFTEFEAIKDDISQHMRLDVALGKEQGRFAEPIDEFVIDSHLAILRAGVSARLAGAGQDVSIRAAEYQLRILGMSIEEARQVSHGNYQKANIPGVERNVKIASTSRSVNAKGVLKRRLPG